jgi:sugar/nucleoside kinase (ribokinase family)
MTEEKRGILFGGNLIVDRVKTIDRFPKRGTLVNILDQARGTGGSAMNNSINVKTLDPDLPVTVMGKVGDDEDGTLILDTLRRLKINTSPISVLKDMPTAYTDVYTEQSGGARTFFSYRGPNALWGYDDISFSEFGKYRIVQIGYILLLDAMDSHDEKYGTRLARTLAEFREMGVRTAVDVVTDLTKDFSSLVVPALKHTDYLVLNELEAGETAGLELRSENDELIRDNVPRAARRLMELGETTELVVIHMPEGAYGVTCSGSEVWVDSFTIPENKIRSTVGAGDAFFSGILYGLHEGKPLEETIRFAHGMAARCLHSPTCTGGAVSFAEMIQFIESTCS